MSKLKTDEKGFGAVEALLIIVIVVLIGTVGYLVYKNHHKITVTKVVTVTKTIPTTSKSTTSISTTKTYTDPSGLFTVSYPSSWTSNVTRLNTDSPIPYADPNLIGFVPSSGQPSSTINSTPSTATIIAFTSSDAQAVLKQQTFGDKQTPAQDINIDGYSAIYQQDIATGVNQLPTYTDDQYVVTNKDVTLLFSFREKQGSEPSSNSAAFDATANVPDFTDIVKSVKFLN